MKKLNAQRRMLAVIQELINNSATGLSNKELAQILHSTEATICRDMTVLSDEKWIERGKGGRWRLSPPFFAGLVEKSLKNLRDIKSKLTEEETYLTSLIS
jgi:DeoR/GlpR family transcriptional regulator of sugar metabolism